MARARMGLAQVAMNSDQYVATMKMIATTLRPIQLVPLADMREFLSTAEIIGPMIDPTAYIRGGRDSLADQADLLDAVDAVQRVMRRIAKRRGVEILGAGT